MPSHKLAYDWATYDWAQNLILLKKTNVFDNLRLGINLRLAYDYLRLGPTYDWAYDWAYDWGQLTLSLRLGLRLGSTFSKQTRFFSPFFDLVAYSPQATLINSPKKMILASTRRNRPCVLMPLPSDALYRETHTKKIATLIMARGNRRECQA